MLSATAARAIEAYAVSRASTGEIGPSQAGMVWAEEVIWAEVSREVAVRSQWEMREWASDQAGWQLVALEAGQVSSVPQQRVPQAGVPPPGAAVCRGGRGVEGEATYSVGEEAVAAVAWVGE